MKNVRRALTAAGIDFQVLSYGSYFSQWGLRLAIKQWSGWPTFPQVFVRGTLIGGEDLTKAALADGSLQTRLGEQGSAASGPDVHAAKSTVSPNSRGAGDGLMA